MWILNHFRSFVLNTVWWEGRGPHWEPGNWVKAVDVGESWTQLPCSSSWAVLSFSAPFRWKKIPCGGKRRGICPSHKSLWEAFGGGQGSSEANTSCEPRVWVGWSIFPVDPHMALLPSLCVDEGHEWGSSPLFWAFRTSFEHHLLLEPLLAPLVSRTPKLWNLLTRR